MDTATLQSIIATFIGFFVVMYFSNQKEDGGFGRSILVSLIMGALMLLLDFGTIGWAVALVAAFLMLTLIQKYSFLASILVIMIGGFISYIIGLGIQHYF